jgi:Glyoxalase-like domain
MIWRLDHLAVAATDLQAGAAAVEEVLGVRLVPGGQHPLMATHNRLLGLGDLYLEVIAPDPVAPAPPHPRWFRLDGFSGPPRLTNWIVATDDLDRALAAAPAGAGRAVALERGDLRWRMGVPDDGCLPHDDAFPALIQWIGAAHPAQRLPDSGLRLRHLVVAHPQAEALRAHLSPYLRDSRLTFEPGARKALHAELDTPHGRRVLQG